jgi:serine/threonine protein kinase
LEYCENGNLYSFLQKHKKIPEGDARHIFKEILEGLEYLHANNILFRDLKL